MQLLVQKNFWSSDGWDLCPDSTIQFFDEKCLKNAVYDIFFTKQKLLQIKISNFYVMQYFSISCTIMEL